LNSTPSYEYARVWVEGYQPVAGTPNTIELYAFWSLKTNDHLVNTSTSAPDGFTAAKFSNGFVFADRQASTVPLQLWYSASRDDYITVASTQGIEFAQQNAYVVVDDAIGYVYSADMVSDTSSSVQYSIALLESASS
jgi:hypothetical protein